MSYIGDLIRAERLFQRSADRDDTRRSQSSHDADEPLDEARIDVERAAEALWTHSCDLAAMRKDTPQHFDNKVMDDIVSAHKRLTDLINGVE